MKAFTPLENATIYPVRERRSYGKAPSFLTGFTLIEVMVSTLILSILVIGIYLILNTGEMAYHTDLGLLNLQQETRRSIDAMSRELREARVVTITPTENFDKIEFTTHRKSNVRYYVDASDVNQDSITNQIIQEYPPLTYKVLANDISSLKFSRTGNFLIIQLQTGKKVVGQRALSFSLQQKVRLRNE